MASPSAVEQRLAYWQNYKYYEGHLSIKVQRTGYEKRWVVLLGNEIHLYTTKIPQREQGSSKPIQHYPLHMSTHIQLDSEYKMYIKCDLWSIRAQATSNEERENWRIRILTLARGEAPDQGRLLPGQQELLADIVQKESMRKHNTGKPLRSRRKSSPGHLQQYSASPGGLMSRRRGDSFTDSLHEQYTDNSHYRFLPDDIAYSQVLPPVWFFGKLSRAKAEEVLHQSTSNGDLLLRESEAHPGQYTLSVRQDTDSKSFIRHYMFKKLDHGNGFLLLIEDKPPVLGSMYELMWFFIQESGGHLLPLQKDPNLPPPNYDISVHVKDPSNGEMAENRRSNFHNTSWRSAEPILQPSPGTRNQQPQAAEDEYLVPDALLQRGRLTSSSSQLGRLSESFEEGLNTYDPGDRMPDREAPRPPLDAAAHRAMPSPPHQLAPPQLPDNSSTGYVKMRSFTTPSPRQPGKFSSPDDVGYTNMRRLDGDEDQDGRGRVGGRDGGGGSPNGKTLTPPPLPRKSRSHHGYCTHLKSVPEEQAETGITSPMVHHIKTPLRPTNSCPPGNIAELKRAFEKFGIREESSA
ncbi:uncharacterized protein [Diadema setosum]|uniref:uncharacterized protein n=1 Tax=Diadema setosum TaxID=31175 RepID=UPI003B3A2D7C